MYLTRYLDLFTTFISFYNTFMKMVFLASSFGTLYLMYLKFRATYDHNHDSFRIEFLLIPCALLSLLINHDFTVMEVSISLSLGCQKIYSQISSLNSSEAFKYISSSLEIIEKSSKLSLNFQMAFVTFSISKCI